MLFTKLKEKDLIKAVLLYSDININNLKFEYEYFSFVEKKDKEIKINDNLSIKVFPKKIAYDFDIYGNDTYYVLFDLCIQSNSVILKEYEKIKYYEKSLCIKNIKTYHKIPKIFIKELNEWSKEIINNIDYNIHLQEEEYLNNFREKGEKVKI